MKFLKLKIECALNMQVSKLWAELASNKFDKVDDLFISNFREPGNANNRLASWDPFENSMRHFKFLLFQQIRNKDNSFFSNYSKIGSTTLGNPVTITGPDGMQINLDHFFSIEEYIFLNRELDLEKIEHVVEIGAGFGRTVQALIKLIPSLQRYTILDLPEVLSLSSKYLEKVLSIEDYSKINFLNALNLSNYNEDLGRINLAINIDSFQEMTKETIEIYFDKVISKSDYFYSKNAIGKYRPESVGLYNVNEQQLLDVFALGLSTDVIDIFNEDILVEARKKHVLQYCPSSNFKILSQEPLNIFPYYHNILYENVRVL